LMVGLEGEDNFVDEKFMGYLYGLNILPMATVGR
jgi:hypothetical protein